MPHGLKGANKLKSLSKVSEYIVNCVPLLQATLPFLLKPPTFACGPPVMDSFARLAVIHGLVPPFRPTLPLVKEDTRRYATYFPSQESLDARSSETDAFSHWTYSAPLPHSGCSSSTTVEAEPADTPAKQIVNHYRAVHCFDDISNMTDVTNLTTRSSLPSEYSEPDYWETASLDEPSIHSSANIKAVYRQSRHEALLVTFQEAIGVAKTSGLGPQDRLACQRLGCRDTLQSARALSYHLHIHDIHDRTAKCPRCRHRVEDQAALDNHLCSKRSNFNLPSFSTAPLRRFFGLVRRPF